jgi:hypothetical protein
MPTRAARNRNTTAPASAGMSGLVATKLRAPGLPAGWWPVRGCWSA